MSRPIIIISHHDDAHIPFVQSHLNRKAYCIDPAKVVQGVELSFIDSTVVYDGVEFNNVGAVWFRKPTPVEELYLPVQKEYKAYSEDSLSRHMGLLRTSFQNAFWLSDFYSITRASNKVWQMQVAKNIGFTAPATIVTSNAARAKEFIKSYKQVVAKSPASKPPIVGKTNMLPTMKFTTAQEAELKGLHLAPAIFQQAIDAVADIRVTVVGDKVFAAITEDKGSDTFNRVRDWRVSQLLGKVQFHPYSLPEPISRQCVELVKALHLEFGAIDFVMDTSGKLWFLEINANGQWAFIEDDTNLPIGKAIAELLEYEASLRSTRSGKKIILAG